MTNVALIVLSDVVFLATQRGPDSFVAMHVPCPRARVKLGPAPGTFGHTVLWLGLGSERVLVKVSCEREVAFWMARLG